MRASWRKWQGNLKEREDADQRRETVKKVLAEGSVWNLKMGKFQAQQVCIVYLLCVVSCARHWGHKPIRASFSLRAQVGERHLYNHPKSSGLKRGTQAAVGNPRRCLTQPGVVGSLVRLLRGGEGTEVGPGR